MTAPFKIVFPLVVTDAVITATDVVEDFQYAAYSPSTTYTKGQRVAYAPTHSVYESVYDGNNTGQTPGAPTSSAYWLRVSPTNKFKMFDSSPSTATTANGTSFYFDLKFYSFVTTMSFMNLLGVLTIRVKIVTGAGTTIHDVTYNTGSTPVVGGSWWDFFFGQRTQPTQLTINNLPFDPTATITVTVTGTANCSVGNAIFGSALTFGLGASYGAEVGFTDYSRKEVNTFGDTILVERPYADRATFQVEIAKEETDSTLAYLKSLRATPFLAIGTDEYESTTLYCYVQDARVTYSYPTYNVLSVELTGMT